MLTYVDVHSFRSRLTNLYAALVDYLEWRETRSQINALFHDRFEEFPGVTEIISRAAYTFINSEPLVDFAAPMLNRIHYIGGIGAKEPNKLDENLDRLLNLRNKTVLISFGSIIPTHMLPPEVKQTIVEVVSRFPEVTFIWKYETVEDDFAQSVLSSTPNLHMMKWTPQNDLLADERVTAFITHGGMGSTQETLLRGKPGLFIPFMGDQPRNAGMMEKSGVGRVFNKLDLYDTGKLFAAVKVLLESDSYRQAAQKMLQMIQKKPFSARETLISTVEFAAEFGPSPALRPQSYDMTWIEYHNADIIAVALIILIASIAVVLNLMMVIVMKIMHSKIKID